MFAIRGCHYSTYKGDEKMAISAIIEKRLLRQRVVLMCSMNKNIVVEINNLEYRDQSQCLQRAREAPAFHLINWGSWKEPRRRRNS
jgi:hypothetical protein